MKYFKMMFLAVCTVFTASCNYLDLVPEGDATLETAFSNRINSEKFLLSCYEFLPGNTSMYNYQGLVGGDEMWWNYDYITDNIYGRALACGYQNATDPCLNYWDGRNGGGNLFQGIRLCNIFLENIHLPYDIDEYERMQWAAEVKFLKAYLHFFLMTMYGPIPIMRENLPIDATPEEVRLYREPVEEVIEYIVQLLDEAVPDLPMEHLSAISNAGRITKAIALSVKAKVLVWAASPLFNNNDYAGFIDTRGKLLIPSEDAAAVKAKWERAAVAIKNAIDTCHLSKHAFFQYTSNLAATLSPEMRLNYTLRYAITEKFNPEIVWPSGKSVGSLQQLCFPIVTLGNNAWGHGELGATLKVAEQYYTRNGLPINEDPEWDYENRYTVQVAGEDHKAYIKTGETTAKLHFDREPRFYASLGFDRGIFEGMGIVNEADFYYLQSRYGEPTGVQGETGHTVTGYNIKKLVNPESTWILHIYNPKNYSYPLIRLSDLFLLYAEALNEAYGPSAEVYKWIDTVRVRAGIPTVEESYAIAAPEFRNKPYEKSTLRDIIKRERLIELAFEGQRFWDLRRWKDAMKYFNEPVRGWNYKESNVAAYYQVTNVWDKRVFNTRDYLWPVYSNSIIINSNLKQNPGWE
jgi:hypothetical protein